MCYVSFNSICEQTNGEIAWSALVKQRKMCAKPKNINKTNKSKTVNCITVTAIDSLPPASIATSIIPHDQISAAVALYGCSNISGATYGNVPHRLSSNRSLPLILSR